MALCSRCFRFWQIVLGLWFGQDAQSTGIGPRKLIDSGATASFLIPIYWGGAPTGIDQMSTEPSKFGLGRPSIDDERYGQVGFNSTLKERQSRVEESFSPIRYAYFACIRLRSSFRCWLTAVGSAS